MDTVEELEKEQPFWTDSSLWVWVNTVAGKRMAPMGVWVLFQGERPLSFI